MAIEINRDSYEHTFWNQTPEIYQDLREPYRATGVPFPTADQALADLCRDIPNRGYRRDTPYVRNLNAREEEQVWQFHWAYSCEDKAIQTSPKADPRAFTGTEYGPNLHWDYITVPMSWQIAETFDEETGLYRRRYDSPIYIGDGVTFENYVKARDARTLRVDPTTASVGTYRRSFTVPEAWDGRENFICFNGVGTSFYVWVNGIYCGYGENRTAISAYNITDALLAGKENTLVVEVYRNSTGNYMEDQDMVRFSGIFRDVYCYSVSKTASLRDFRAYPIFDGAYKDAELHIKTYLHSYSNADLSRYTVTASLYDGKELVTEKRFSASDVEIVHQEELSAHGDYTTFVRESESELVLKTSLAVAAPKHWTDETPYLYNLVLSVSDENGLIEATGCKVGFRMLELMTAPCGKQYYTINGKRIVLNGVNRHEMWLDGGAWVSPEHHRLELAQMKALNINSIRTSHYNCDPTLYDYCDEYGIFVFAEANVETASDIDDPDAPVNRGPSMDDFEDGKMGPPDIVGEPSQAEKDSAIARRLGFAEASEMQLRLEPALLDRQKTNVIPNKNHPSVIIWSICNEAGSGTPYRNMHRWVSNYEEENRIIFYKAEYEGNTVRNLDYPSPAAIINYCESSDPRPLILSEYGYSEVQGRGGLSDSYVFVHDMAKDYLNFLGMYVWSWKDQSFFAYGSDTDVEEMLRSAGLKRYLGYQGMWSKKLYGAQNGHFALGAFACTGIVTGNNAYKPEAADLKAAYGRIRVEATDLSQGKLRIVNRYAFRNLSDFDLCWHVTDGETIFASGTESIELTAGCSFVGQSVAYASREVIIPEIAMALQAAPLATGAELFVNLSFVRKSAPAWAKYARNPFGGTIDGDTTCKAEVFIEPMEVSTHQFQAKRIPAQMVTEQGCVQVQEDPEGLLICCGMIQWRINKGILTNCRVQDRELMTSPLKPELYAVINEQLGPSAGQCTKTDWLQAAEEMELQSVACRQVSSGLCIVETCGNLQTMPESMIRLRYCFYGDGQVFLTTMIRFGEGLGNVPALGWSLCMPCEYTHVKYLGAGPGESYWDRHAGTIVAAYETTPDQMFFPYLYPTESGNRTDCRWMTVTDQAGCGLLFSAVTDYLQCSVLHHTSKQLRSEKKWSRSYYELLLPEYRTENSVVRILHDMTGHGMGLATDYLKHVVPSGTDYCFTIGIRPIQTEQAYPAVKEITSMLRRPEIPDRLFSGLTINGDAVENFHSDTAVYTIDVVRADYARIGDGALPEVAVNLGPDVMLKEEETGTLKCNGLYVFL